MKNSKKGVVDNEGMGDKLYVYDKLYWQMIEDPYPNFGFDSVEYTFIPICPECRAELKAEQNNSKKLQCPICNKYYNLSKGYINSVSYVKKMHEANKRKKMQLQELDGVLIKVDAKKQKNDKYFVTAQIKESKNGDQLVIYAGKKGSNKSQIFITPEDRKMTFDQHDLNPADIFVRVTAEFYDGTKHTIEGGKK